MAKYNRILLNYLKNVMYPNEFAIYLDFIGQDEDIESFYDEDVEEENIEKEGVDLKDSKK